MECVILTIRHRESLQSRSAVTRIGIVDHGTDQFIRPVTDITDLRDLAVDFRYSRVVLAVVVFILVQVPCRDDFVHTVVVHVAGRNNRRVHDRHRVCLFAAAADEIAGLVVHPDRGRRAPSGIVVTDPDAAGELFEIIALIILVSGSRTSGSIIETCRKG